jgi:hypothetical protein
VPGLGYMPDLKSTKLIYLKGLLFAVMLAVSAALLLAESCTWKTAFLVAILIWSSARLYYFMFYVIEKYTDPAFKFAGIFSFVQYLFRKRRS